MSVEMLDDYAAHCNQFNIGARAGAAANSVRYVQAMQLAFLRYEPKTGVVPRSPNSAAAKETYAQFLNWVKNKHDSTYTLRWGQRMHHTCTHLDALKYYS